MSQKGEYILRHQRKSHNLIICTSDKNSVLVQDMLHANEARKNIYNAQSQISTNLNARIHRRNELKIKRSTKVFYISGSKSYFVLSLCFIIFLK
jgi:tRNA A37 N6-isopentenylltransferase MiaA